MHFECTTEDPRGTIALVEALEKKGPYRVLQIPKGGHAVTIEGVSIGVSPAVDEEEYVVLKHKNGQWEIIDRGNGDESLNNTLRLLLRDELTDNSNTSLEEHSRAA